MQKTIKEKCSEPLGELFQSERTVLILKATGKQAQIRSVSVHGVSLSHRILWYQLTDADNPVIIIERIEIINLYCFK